MKTAIITSSTSLNHLTGNGHPENPDRVTVVIEKLKQNKYDNRVIFIYLSFDGIMPAKRQVLL